MAAQEHEKIDYVEFPTADIPATQNFFKSVFGWKFTDYGPEYTAFDNQGVEGGFYKSDKKSLSEEGAALVIFYSKDLEATRAKVEDAGGEVIKPIFSFPGGRRFHFTEPGGGSEFAVWSDKGMEE